MKASFSIRATGDSTLLVVLYAVLCLASLAILWSVTEGLRDPAYQSLQPDVAKVVFWRQAVWILLGTIALVVASRISLQLLEEGRPSSSPWRCCCCSSC